MAQIHGVDSADLLLFSPATRRMRPLLMTPAIEYAGEISPDGKWIALVVNIGSSMLRVETFPQSGGPTAASWSCSARRTRGSTTMSRSCRAGSTSCPD